jgi:hypothetical protein
MSFLIQNWIDRVNAIEGFEFLRHQDRVDLLTNSMLRALKKKKESFGGFSYSLPFSILYGPDRASITGMQGSLNGRLIEWRGVRFDGMLILDPDPQAILENRIPSFYALTKNDILKCRPYHSLPGVAFERFESQSCSIHHLGNREKELDKKVLKAFQLALSAERDFLQAQTHQTVSQKSKSFNRL